MDLIEKFCCWKYIFLQLHAGCLQVPTVCVYVNVDSYWDTQNLSVFTVVHGMYLKSKILLVFVIIDQFPVGALKEKMVNDVS